MTDLTEARVRHVTSYYLELRRLGQMPGDDQRWMDEHLRACAACADLALAHLDRRQQFEGAVRTRSLAALAPRLQRRRWWRLRLRALGLGLLVPAAVVGLLLWVSAERRRPAPIADDGDDTDLIVKGGPAFFLAARRGDRVFRVRPGEPLRPRDQVRFVLEHLRFPYVMIASVDGRGRANVYVPYEGAESAALGGADGAERIEIPGSIIIDDSPGPERMFALLSRKPLPAAPVRSALGALGSRGPTAIREATSLDVGADQQLSLVVEKASGADRAAP